MATILKDFNHVTVVEGELVPSSSSFDLEDLLGNFDNKRIIKMQFDRLDSSFQEFLTVSSSTSKYKDCILTFLYRSPAVWINILQYSRFKQ
jgi:hypothetical protein